MFLRASPAVTTTEDSVAGASATGAEGALGSATGAESRLGSAAGARVPPSVPGPESALSHSRRAARAAWWEWRVG